VRHSLFRDRNNWNRISADEMGVPMKKENDDPQNFASPDSYVAYKVAKYYKSVFDFLDTDVDD